MTCENTPPPSRRSHLHVLDLLRGIAILLVFAHHCFWWHYGKSPIQWSGLTRDLHQPIDRLLFIPFSLGWAGVSVFFVVSGFCIHLSHLRDASSGRGFMIFFIKRFWRIYPPYLAAVVLFLAGDILTGQISGKEEIFKQTWTHLALLHNFWNDTYHGINPSFWSIAVEAQLYLIYPILWWIGKTRGWLFALLISAFSEIGIQLLISLPPHLAIAIPKYVSAGPFAYWFSWALGAYLADMWSQNKHLRISPTLAWIAGVLFILSWFIHPLRHFGFTSAAILTFALIGRTIFSQTQSPDKQSLFYKEKLNRMLSFFGLISFSFYLFHQPLISISNKLLLRLQVQSGNPWVDFIVLLVSIIPITAFSWLTYRWLEKPSMATGKKFLHLHVKKGA